MDKQTSETWDDKVREMLNARRGIVAPPAESPAAIAGVPGQAPGRGSYSRAGIRANA